MTTQLTLLPKATAPWRIDDTTRAIGMRGLAEARQVLAEARARHTTDANHTAANADHATAA